MGKRTFFALSCCLVSTALSATDFTNLCVGVEPKSSLFGVLAAMLDSVVLPVMPPLDLETCTILETRIHANKTLSMDPLEMSGWTVNDLRPIGFFDDLRQLAIYNVDTSHLSDLSPLSHATQLSNINISQATAIKDLRPLAKLINLQSLSLQDSTQLHSIAGLETLPILSDIGLYNICVDDLQNLASAPSLRRLDYGCVVNNLAFAQGLKHLEHLRLPRGDNISDLSPIYGISGLKELIIERNNKILNVQGIEALSHLTRIYLGEVVSSHPLTALPELDSLRFATSEQALSDFSKLSKLRQLSFGGAVLEDVSGLSGLNALKDLQIWNGNLIYFGALKLPALRTLQVNEQHGGLILKDFSGMPSLEEISLTHDGVSDLSPILQLKKVRILDISSNKLMNLSGLENFKDLEVLNVAYNKICSFSNELLKLRYSHYNSAGQIIRLSISGMSQQDLSNCP